MKLYLQLNVKRIKKKILTIDELKDLIIRYSEKIYNPYYFIDITLYLKYILKFTLLFRY